MIRRMIAGLAVVGLAAATVATVNGATARYHAEDGLAVHEWGTFTTVAGPTGAAIEWLPLAGPTDLPCFVEHFLPPPLSIVGKVAGVIITPLNQSAASQYDFLRGTTWAKVRMETPVLYFYSPRDVTVDVSVQFPRGLITEWYPKASSTARTPTNEQLRSPAYVGSIAWNGVAVTPAMQARYPRNAGESHYYAARETEAAPVNVSGQTEKFLFYRGIANFDVPIEAVPVENGVRISNVGPLAMGGIVLFENRGGKIGYRALGSSLAPNNVATIQAPELRGNLADLRATLERTLVEAGLYQKEAAAMVETWRDSWFEEGLRVLYVVPQHSVDRILPLTVTPTPDHTARVFVGRMEVLSPSIIKTVSEAFARSDTATVARYGRFLGPISERLLTPMPSPAHAERIFKLRNAVFAKYTSVGACAETH
jgi:hypothetical protein